MEELLNKLIKKGWKPFGIYDKLMGIGQSRNKKVLCFGMFGEIEYTLRQLTSKESGLWQFCVENDIVDYSKVRAYGISFAPLELQNAGEMQNYDNIHRLLWDCASLDEDELDKFLLENIKIS